MNSKTSADNAINKLKNLVPLNTLCEDALTKLVGKAKFISLEPGDEVYSRYGDDNYLYYLLEGSIRMTDGQGKAAFLNAGGEQAKYAFGRLKPRPADAIVDSEHALLVQFNSIELDTAVTWNEMVNDHEASGSELQAAKGLGVEVYDMADSGSTMDTGWLMSLLNSKAFQQIPPENIQKLSEKMTAIEVSAGDTIIRQGEQGDCYYVVREGRCNVLYNDVKIGEIDPMGCFGEEALISGDPRNATVVMAEDGILMRLSKVHFDYLLVPSLILKINLTEAVEKAREGAILIDVRTREEYKHDRLGRSINIPLSILRMKFNKLENHSHKTLIVYCDTGARSSAAGFLLKQAGFDVYTLEDPQQAFLLLREKRQTLAAA